MSKYELVSLVIQGVSATVIGLGVLAYFQTKGQIRQQRKAFEAESEWRRLQHICDLFAQWNSELDEPRRRISRAFPGVARKDKRGAPGRNECAQIVTAEKGQHEVNDKVDAFDLRHDLFHVFNYFENIAYGYRGYSEKPDVKVGKVVKVRARGTMMRWCGFFEEFISAVEEEHGYRPWPDLQDLIEEWESEDRAKK